ncbi:MAG: sigma-54-dependent Fis family transcriptional regulator, partial [Nitrospirae bacterium]|nr:sigma-54-dependent Fis family transcriptional regulator [Nitrospirota bacterium]
REFKKRVSGLSKEVESLLLSYPWPGNIRELKNVIERAMILAEDDTILLDALPPEIVNTQAGFQKSEDRSQKTEYRIQETEDRIKNKEAGIKEHKESQNVSLNAVEKECILKALVDAKGNRSIAARSLGISRTTLWKKLKEYGVYF